MTALRLDGGVRRDDFTLRAQLTLPRGTTAIMGPNGSGKTTLLRVLAGLTALTEGRLTGPDGETWDAPPARPTTAQDRRVGLLLADPVLFPHLSCRDNVAFGPRMRGAPRDDARTEAERELEAVGLTGLTGRRPGSLSTGQAQRVALARALAARPALLLLDEPLSALDPTTRSELRSLLHHRLTEYDGTTVLVTHDPLDALTLADHLVFLDDGQVVQRGSPAEVVDRPRNSYVAEVVGLNLLRAQRRSSTVASVDGTPVHVGSLPESTDLWLTVPPRAVSLWPTQPAAGSPRNTWPMTVTQVDLSGQQARVHLTGVLDLVAEVTPGAVHDLGLRPGATCWATVKATEVIAYPE